jgi:hypothetical protein
VVRCNSNSLLIQWIGRSGEIEKQRQLIELKKKTHYFMTQPIVMTCMVHEKSRCPLIYMFVYLFIRLGFTLS